MRDVQVAAGGGRVYDGRSAGDPRVMLVIMRQRHWDRTALAIACVILLAACLHGITGPWEAGHRGANGGHYSSGAVIHTLQYGLGTTLGMPAFITESGGELHKEVNWHHPPIYWLYLSGYASIFGHTPFALRVAHLLLFLPGALAFFLFVRRECGPMPGALAFLLLSATPLYAYYGPMVIQDGATLGFGFIGMLLCSRYAARPTRRTMVALCGAFFATCSLDFSGYWWGPVLCLVLWGRLPARQALRAAAVLFCTSVAAFAVLALHYGVLFDGPLGYVSKLLGTVAHDSGRDHQGAQLADVVRELLVDAGNWPVMLAAFFGLPFAVGSRNRLPRKLARIGLVLLLPGVLNVVVLYNHFLGHVFWPIHGFGGVACLAAAAVVGFWGLPTESKVLEVVRGGVLAGLAGVCIAGVAATHGLIARYARSVTPAERAVSQALPLLSGCSRTMTSDPGGDLVFVGHTQVFGGIDSLAKLDASLALRKRFRVPGLVGFVLTPRWRNTPLHHRLNELAEGLGLGDLIVFRLPP